MDDSATLTIAMSRMVMNCTARMSPSANHFLLSEPTIRYLPESSCLGERGMLHDLTCYSQVDPSIPIVKPLHSARGQELPAVLPDRPCPRSRRGALVAARGPRTAA